MRAATTTGPSPLPRSSVTLCSATATPRVSAPMTPANRQRRDRLPGYFEMGAGAGQAWRVYRGAAQTTPVPAHVALAAAPGSLTLSMVARTMGPGMLMMKPAPLAARMVDVSPAAVVTNRKGHSFSMHRRKRVRVCSGAGPSRRPPANRLPLTRYATGGIPSSTLPPANNAMDSLRLQWRSAVHSDQPMACTRPPDGTREMRDLGRGALTPRNQWVATLPHLLYKYWPAAPPVMMPRPPSRPKNSSTTHGKQEEHADSWRRPPRQISALGGARAYTDSRRGHARQPHGGLACGCSLNGEALVVAEIVIHVGEQDAPGEAAGQALKTGRCSSAAQA